MDMVTTTVSKWGNSLALRIPQQVATELGISENTNVSINVENGRLYIQKKLTLENLVDSISFETVHRDIILDDGPVGKETL
jgi:antitoxin MazE